MEKESLISSLKERIGENDFNAISRRSVETIIEPLLPMFADDEKVTEETYALPVALLKSFIGQSRHDIAEGIKGEKARFEAEKLQAVKDAVEAAKLEWKKGEEPKEPKPKEPKGNEPDVSRLIDEKLENMLNGLVSKDGAIGKLTDSLDTFIKNYETKRKQETVADIRRRLTDSLEGLGADRPAVIELAIEKMEIDGEKAYEDLLAEAKSVYEGLYKKLYADGPQPFAGGGNGEPSDASFKDFIARQQKDAERQAKDAEALRGKMM